MSSWIITSKSYGIVCSHSTIRIDSPGITFQYFPMICFYYFRNLFQFFSGLIRCEPIEKQINVAFAVERRQNSHKIRFYTPCSWHLITLRNTPRLRTDFNIAVTAPPATTTLLQFTPSNIELVNILHLLQKLLMSTTGLFNPLNWVIM